MKSFSIIIVLFALLMFTATAQSGPLRRVQQAGCSEGVVVNKPNLSHPLSQFAIALSHEVANKPTGAVELQVTIPLDEAKKLIRPVFFFGNEDKRGTVNGLSCVATTGTNYHKAKPVDLFYVDYDYGQYYISYNAGYIPADLLQASPTDSTLVQFYFVCQMVQGYTGFAASFENLSKSVNFGPNADMHGYRPLFDVFHW